MRPPPLTPGRSLLLGLAAVLAAASPAPAGAAGLTFERAFGGVESPLHCRVAYASGGSPHRLELWRDGDRRVRRRTDDVLETYATRRAGSPEYSLSVLDLRRRIHSRVDRTSLYRIGSFTEWFELGHGLRHPTGPYRLTRAAATGTARPLEACDWYELAQGARRSRICWSPRHRLPLLIEDGRGAVVWRVTSLDREPPAASVFEVHDEGFVRNDAAADISGD
ncbi:hypothetical protein [Anaeromyxobacter paludicola]|uniref:DUF3108 domain-containing protein n=1 Tax=Anaeromyxobacter paludicola TaxID=2918171 RepID=A0ABM7X5G3_9BACT|nr:hypothetical protein [Anaeromyxobacter paludicola]BDG07040.1 hypothetical protein AMPC_01530 [Anaeromyxobacter paludicola]